jgi:hypothetical protein
LVRIVVIRRGGQIAVATPAVTAGLRFQEMVTLIRIRMVGGVLKTKITKSGFCSASQAHLRRTHAAMKGGPSRPYVSARKGSSASIPCAVRHKKEPQAGYALRVGRSLLPHLGF